MAAPRKPIDRIIEEARQEGKFDDLEGKGKPLALDMSPDAVIKNLLKEANVKPEWIELGGQIDRQLQEAERLLETYAAEHDAAWRALTQADASGEPQAAAPEDRAASESRRRQWWRAFIGRLFALRPSRPAGAGDEQALAAFRNRWDATLASYAGLLHQTNRKIRRFNRIVPLSSRQRMLIPVEQRLEAFAERFPRLARAPDGSLHPERGTVPQSLLSPPPEPDEPRAARTLEHAAALRAKRSFGRRPPPIG